MICMFRENAAKKQGNISNSFIERRTHLRVNDASQLDHVIQVDVAEASFMPSAALLPVNVAAVCTGKGRKHFGYIDTGLFVREHLPHCRTLKDRDTFSLAIHVKDIRLLFQFPSQSPQDRSN